MRVLLTGASGFIGSNVLRYLLGKTDWTFVCPVSFRHYGNGYRLSGLDFQRVEVKYLDLRGVIPDIGDFDYILNLASESHVDRSIEAPVPFIENNVTSTLQMLEYARKHPPKMFIQFSTDEVYGAQLGSNDEWRVMLPSNPYAASKAAQEMICIAYWRTYGVPLVITNSNNVVGPNQDTEKFIPKVINLIKTGEPVAVHVTSKGQPGSRRYNPVENVADSLLFILCGSLPITPEFPRPARYGIPGGTELNNEEVVQLIGKLLQLPYTINYVNVEGVLRPGYDQAYAETAGTLIEMGWSPPYTLEETLRDWVACPNSKSIMKSSAENLPTSLITSKLL